LLPGEVQRCTDVGGGQAAGDRYRAAIDVVVPLDAGGVIVGVLGRYHLPSQHRAERFQMMRRYLHHENRSQAWR
jgi:hypothetical protein